MAKAPVVEEFKQYEWIAASSSVPRNKQRLMIVLHGRGDSLKAFRSIKEELRLPEMNYLLLNAPRSYDGGFTWYAFPPNQANGVLLARKKLTALLHELEFQGWPSEEIFFYGFSQGCLVSCDFAMNSGIKFGGVIGISGYIYFFENWKRKLTKASFATPMLVTHGVFDEDLPIIETREHIEKLKAAGLNLLWKEFNKEHEIDEEIETPFIRQWVRAQINRTASKEPSSIAQTVSKFLLGNRGRSARASGTTVRR